jgi:hypothetical protein
MDIRLALLTGVDIPVPECQIAIHQPTIKEISMIGENDFFVGVQCLCLYKSMFIEDKNVLDEVNNFQIFMTVVMSKEEKEKKISVIQVLSILFPGFKALFTPRSLILQKGEIAVTIDESNFEILQDYLRQIFCSNSGSMDQQAFNPVDEKAREIAEKLMRGRQRVAAQKGGSNSSVFSKYLSILSVGLPMSMAELTNLTMFQIYDLMERYSLYTNWDIDIRTRLAGGKPDSQPDNWMKDIH